MVVVFTEPYPYILLTRTFSVFQDHSGIKQLHLMVVFFGKFLSNRVQTLYDCK